MVEFKAERSRRLPLLRPDADPRTEKTSGAHVNGGALVVQDLLPIPDGMTAVDLSDGRRVVAPEGTDPEAYVGHPVYSPGRRAEPAGDLARAHVLPNKLVQQRNLGGEHHTTRIDGIAAAPTLLASVSTFAPSDSGRDEQEI